MKFNLKKKYFYFFLIPLISTLHVPAFAYAGPGAALGVVIVFITVVIAFVISIFLTSYKFIKRLFIKVTNFFKKNSLKLKTKKKKRTIK